VTLNTHDLKNVTDMTLEHYNKRADDFWEGTRGHDVSQNIATLLQHIEGRPPFTILDFWVRTRPRSQDIPRVGACCRWTGGFDAFCCNGP
jgi:hypothetical protein